jgi:hypothetical protein
MNKRALAAKFEKYAILAGVDWYSMQELPRIQ